MSEAEKANQKMEIERLITKKRTLTSRLSSFETFISDTEVEKDLTIVKLKSMAIDNIVKEFNQIQGRIVDLVIDIEEAYNTQTEQAELFEEKVFQVKAKYLSFIEKADNTSRSVSGNANDSTSNTNNVTNKCKLPPLSMPKFSGHVQGWQTFYDTFVSLIHENNSLGDTQKFHYLRASLDGEALKVIETIPVTEANYKEALEKLEARYKNKKLVRNSHLQSLFALESIRGSSSMEIKKLLDAVNGHLQALKTLDCKIEHWDPIIIHLVTSRLDADARRMWALETSSNDSPKFKELTEFITKRAHALETVEKPQVERAATTRTYQKTGELRSYHVNDTVASRCFSCGNLGHRIYRCEDFLKMTVPQREAVVKNKKLCRNCLRYGHTLSECRSSGCRTCGRKHSSLLHVEWNVNNRLDKTNVSGTSDNAENRTSSAVSDNDRQLLIHRCAPSSSQGVLATVRLRIQSLNGDWCTVRALLDPGAQGNLITLNCAKRLSLAVNKCNVQVNGIPGLKSVNVSQSASLTIKSRVTDFSVQIVALIMRRVTAPLPTQSFEISVPERYHDVLADPDFGSRGEIDLLLGSEIFLQIFNAEPAERIAPSLFIKSTVFGYVIAGRHQNNTINRVSIHNCLVSDSLKRFWEIEQLEALESEIPVDLCERHFLENVVRLPSGRYEVALPFKAPPESLGESRTTAEHILRSTLKRLSPSQRRQYDDFLREYAALGHMRLIPAADIDKKPHCYLPHHAVFKNSLTSDIRVVFNASKKTSSGVSLNDILHVGPNLTRELFDVLIRFRLHAVAIVADMAKMYRQIQVRNEDAPMQRIVWIENGMLRYYELCTVTYGTAPAAFLANRTLRQLAADEKEKYPYASDALAHDTYVDDLITGAENLPAAIELVQSLNEMTRKGGFQLRKWASNFPSILSTLAETNGNDEFLVHPPGEVPTLGMVWRTNSDEFAFRTNLPDLMIDEKVTKRQVLSQISRLFDPLGLVAPLIIRTKIFMRTLWREGLDWDTPLGEELRREWFTLRDGIASLRVIVPRRALSLDNEIEMHCFGDASENAYGACIYVRSNNQVTGQFDTNLLAAKTRVAPIKGITIARLELCAALLASRLYQRVRPCIPAVNRVIFYSDSTTVLAWLRKEPSTWKTFVAHRVHEIQNITEPFEWRYISTCENPADLLSRGLTGDALAKSVKWWNGPSASFFESEPELPDSADSTVLEKRKPKICLVNQNEVADTGNCDVIFTAGSFDRLVRRTAYVLRFCNNARNRSQRSDGFLQPEEIEVATMRIIKCQQHRFFADEINSLASRGNVKKKNPLSPLAPFLDDFGVLRVGGRIRNASLPYEHKHPALMSDKSIVSALYVRKIHLQFLHAGVNLTVSRVRQMLWILRAKDVVKREIGKCVTCRKFSARTLQQKMSDLPHPRVNVAPAFTHTGVDYAGPIEIKAQNTRAKTTIKGYIVFFVCMSTRAVHIELTTGLSTDAFMTAFTRFTCRRGMPNSMCSDNATNFHGAANEFQRLFSNDEVHDRLSSRGIKWSFICANAPHHGGIWERGIRSVKSHLYRTIGDHKLTYDEMSTILVKIEACLNSRPISSSSNDPNDFEPLTPAHFLIQRPLHTIPQEPIEGPINYVRRWKLVQHLQQTFWKRWRDDYLHQLQTRYKWKTSSPNLQVNELVAIKENELPPYKWSMGRVVEVKVGPDSFVRSALIKTPAGSYWRPITKIVLLSNVD